MRIRTTVEKLAHMLGQDVVFDRLPLDQTGFDPQTVVEVNLSAYVEWDGEYFRSKQLLTALLLLLNHPERP